MTNNSSDQTQILNVRIYIEESKEDAELKKFFS